MHAWLLKFHKSVVYYDIGLLQRIIFLTLPFQYIASPRYPNNYPNNVRCQWMLSAPRGERISVKVTDIYMEQSPGCRKDKLSVMDVVNHVRFRCNRIEL